MIQRSAPHQIRPSLLVISIGAGQRAQLADRRAPSPPPRGEMGKQASKKQWASGAACRHHMVRDSTCLAVSIDSFIRFVG